MKQRVFNIVLALFLTFGLLSIAAFGIYGSTNKSSGGVVYVGFASDVHGQMGNLTSWFDSIPQKTDLQYMGYCGDYSYETGSSYIQEFNQIVSITNEKVGDNRGIYTSANHCYWNVDGPSNPLNSAFTSTTGYCRIGEAVNNDNYTIYCFGVAPGDGSDSFAKSDIDTLSDYLKTADTDEPIFILSHYPIHNYVGEHHGRTTKNASKVIDLLNQYPNAVFIWGHNHSQGDTHYGEIKTKGDSITYANDKSKEINFTYLSAGSMRDGCVGMDKYYGMVATVAKNGKSVTFDYYDTAGVNQGSKTVFLDGK